MSPRRPPSRFGAPSGDAASPSAKVRGVTIETITAAGIVPVVVLDDAAVARPLAQALLDGGIATAEVTFRTPAAAASIEAMRGVAGLTVGAGTVITPEQVDTAVDAGASYVVSPGMSRRVVRRCAARGVLCLPGVASASELMAALEEGISVVKFFPAEAAGGAAAVAALAAPFPQVRFVPTGSIGTANLASYLAIPAVLAVGGSWMVPRPALASGDFATVTRLSREAVAAVGTLREVHS